MFKISLILVMAVSGTRAVDYFLELEELYSECTNGPVGSVPLDVAFNVDNFRSVIDADGVHVSGNVTTVWDFDRTDRLSVNSLLLKLPQNRT